MDMAVVQWMSRQMTRMAEIQSGERLGFEGDWMRANFVRFCVACLDPTRKTPFPELRDSFSAAIYATFDEEQIEEALFWTKRVLRDIDYVQRAQREFQRRGFFRGMSDVQKLAALVCKNKHVQLIWEPLDADFVRWILERIKTTNEQRAEIERRGYTTDLRVVS